MTASAACIQAAAAAAVPLPAYPFLSQQLLRGPTADPHRRSRNECHNQTTGRKRFTLPADLGGRRRGVVPFAPHALSSPPLSPPTRPSAFIAYWKGATHLWTSSAKRDPSATTCGFALPEPAVSVIGAVQMVLPPVVPCRGSRGSLISVPPTRGGSVQPSVPGQPPCAPARRGGGGSSDVGGSDAVGPRRP